MIITKKSLIENWKRELVEHTNILPTIFSENRRKNIDNFLKASRLALGHFEFVATEFLNLEDWCSSMKVGIIIDESAKSRIPSKVNEMLLQII